MRAREWLGGGGGERGGEGANTPFRHPPRLRRGWGSTTRYPREGWAVPAVPGGSRGGPGPGLGDPREVPGLA